MEGAAIFYVCLMENIPFAEIRSISNYAGEMDKSKWNIPLAIKILCETVEKVMEEITYLR
jgi:futalosine hydrolase